MDNIHANNKELKPVNSPAQGGNTTVSKSESSPAESIRIEVYKGNEFIGKKIFSQDRIIIGRSLEADLVLSHEMIADQHACITLIDKQIVILDQTQKASLMIKGTLCGISIINLFEHVGIGPYILKIIHQKGVMDNVSHESASNDDSCKNEAGITSGNDEQSATKNTEAGVQDQNNLDIHQSKKNETPEVDLFSLFEGSHEEEDKFFDLVFEGAIKEGLETKDVKSSLAKILKVDESRIEHFFKGNRIVIKSSLEIETAKKYKGIVEKSGIICRLYVSKHLTTHTPLQVKAPEKNSSLIIKQSSIKKEIEKIESPKKIEPGEKVRQFKKKEEEKAVWKFYGAETDDECDEDEIDLPADFLPERQNQ